MASREDRQFGLHHRAYFSLCNQWAKVNSSRDKSKSRTLPWRHGLILLSSKSYTWSQPDVRIHFWLQHRMSPWDIACRPMERFPIRLATFQSSIARKHEANFRNSSARPKAEVFYLHKCRVWCTRVARSLHYRCSSSVSSNWIPIRSWLDSTLRARMDVRYSNYLANCHRCVVAKLRESATDHDVWHNDCADRTSLATGQSALDNQSCSSSNRTLNETASGGHDVLPIHLESQAPHKPIAQIETFAKCHWRLRIEDIKDFYIHSPPLDGNLI